MICSTIDYIDKITGAATTITNMQVRSFQTSFQSRAENILAELGVSRLTEHQILSIHDSGEGAGKNICSCNSVLVDFLELKDPKSAMCQQKTLKLIAELTLITLCLTSIEGNGHIRFTESMASIFTDPSNFDTRSLRWEFGRVLVACGWFKSETTSSEVALAVKRATLKVCSSRTSRIFIHTALAVKPLEVRLVHSIYGEAAASVHWTAFGARKGIDMCTEPNLEWARSYFNRTATLYLNVTLQELRHVWIGIGRRVSDNFADKANDDFTRIVRNASARQSHHSANTERKKYAGQDGSMLGHEAGDRQLYRALSENFNREVFGCDSTPVAASDPALVAASAPAAESGSATASASASASPTGAVASSVWSSGAAPAAACSSTTNSVTPSATAPAPTSAPASASKLVLASTSAPSLIAPEEQTASAFTSDFTSVYGVSLIDIDDGITNDELQEEDALNLPDTAAAIPAVSYEVIRSKMQKIVRDGENALLIQRPGFGKTRIIIELLASNSFFLVLVPTTALRDQMVVDIRAKGFLCLSGDETMNQDPDCIVAQHHAGVWIFDNMPHLAPVARAGVAANKQTAIVIDEVHQLNQDKSYRFIFNRAWELGSLLSLLNGKLSWILLSATVRRDEEELLFQALNLTKFENVIRGSTRIPGTQVDIHEESLPGPPAQLTFVRSRAEAEIIAAKLGAACWHSKLDDETKVAALKSMAEGHRLVATYGLGVGLNIRICGQPITSVDIHGTPYSASCLVQAVGRIRNGGTARLFVPDLYEKMRSTNVQEKEIATLLFDRDIEGIFDLFDAPSAASEKKAKETVTTGRNYTPQPFSTFEIHKRNASLVQQYVPEVDVCVICDGAHETAKCTHLNGICFVCGERSFFKHSAANCPSRHCNSLLVAPKHFCCRCRLPLFEIAGIKLHSSDIGFDCQNAALADQVKLLLLAGQIFGTRFGPNSYNERVVWVTESSPPNIVGLLARVVMQQHQQQHPTLAKIRTRTQHSPERSPSHDETPPTHKRSKAESIASTSRQLLVQKLADAILRGLPHSVFPGDRCFKCAAKHRSDTCTEPPASCISGLLMQAKCCTQCAIPLYKAGGHNLHPHEPGKHCSSSRFFMHQLVTQPRETILSTFKPGLLDKQLELLSSFCK
jgi:hypothetical protein